LIAIATATSETRNRPFFSILPYAVAKDTLGEEAVLVYTLSKCYRSFFSNIIKHLQKKHPQLICSEELGMEGPLLSHSLLLRLPEILSLTDSGIPKNFAILCERDESRLPKLLKTVAPFAQSVSVVTDRYVSLEGLCKNMLEEYGLSVNQRDISQLEHMDMAFLLSGTFNLSRLKTGRLCNLSSKKVSVPIPTLRDLTSKETADFLARHPHLRIKHFPLLPKNAPITNLIWKYC